MRCGCDCGCGYACGWGWGWGPPLGSGAPRRQLLLLLVPFIVLRIAVVPRHVVSGSAHTSHKQAAVDVGVFRLAGVPPAAATSGAGATFKEFSNNLQNFNQKNKKKRAEEQNSCLTLRRPRRRKLPEQPAQARDVARLSPIVRRVTILDI